MLRLRSSTARYGLALVATALASLLYFLSGPVELGSDIHYFGFILAVLVAAILGGMGPGLLATALSAFASAYLLLPPIYSIQVGSHDQVARLILFGGEGVLLSLVGRILHEADTAEIETAWTKRYLAVFLFVSTATGLKLLAFRDLERALPFTFFYAAIAGSAWVGGFGPGLAGTLLSSLAAACLFLLPRCSISAVSALTAERIGVFILEGVLISGLGAMYPRARRLADQAIEQTRQYSRRLRRTMEDIRALRLTSKDVIWELNPASNRVTLGATEAERPETSTATRTLTSWLQQVHPEDRSSVAASLTSALRESRDEWICEYRRLRSGGRSAHILDHAYIIRNAAGNPIRVVGRSADVGESKRVPHIVGLDRQYRALFEQSPLAILLIDQSLRIIRANSAACDVLAYSSSQLLQMHANELFPARAQEAIVEMLLVLTGTGRSSIAFQEPCVRGNGDFFEAKINVAAIEIEDESSGWVVMIEEINA
jgi:PAS domain S-box-containing protein